MNDRGSGEPLFARRRVLALAGSGAVAALAGCLGGDGASDGESGTDRAGTDEPETTESPTEATTTAVTASGATDGATTTTTEATARNVTAADAAFASATAGAAGGDLDLREANVVGAAFERDGGASTFDVTLLHDDSGENGYANWWQVETLAGERLGRRTLRHAHGTREFTRSETIELPEVTRVVVRGHDRTHGYGGRAAIVDLESGEIEGVRQGPEPRSFEGDRGRNAGESPTNATEK
ncbi:hypothetical protein BRC90_05005 [Halobacteriales archaeon QS_4_69_34]|nr:MAG: hypothetical protein BRC90_05005 [Halobacteriales archaeon QS_4_69_34]